jgi:hypothetical protein
MKSNIKTQTNPPQIIGAADFSRLSQKVLIEIATVHLKRKEREKQQPKQGA